MKRNVLNVVLMLAVLIGTASPVLWTLVLAPLKMVRISKKMVGRGEAELAGALGPPRFVVTVDTLAGRTVDYPWKGMNFVPVPDYPVRNKVYLYCWMSLAVYVYLNEQGIVEHVASAGT